MGQRGAKEVRGGWKVRGRQLIPGRVPEWMRIRYHEQSIVHPSKWVFFTFNARGYAQIIDYLLCKYEDRIFCVQVKNKPCVVNIILRLFPWKCPRGSETTTICAKIFIKVAYFCSSSMKICFQRRLKKMKIAVISSDPGL